MGPSSSGPREVLGDRGVKLHEVRDREAMLVGNEAGDVALSPANTASVVFSEVYLGRGSALQGADREQLRAEAAERHARLRATALRTLVGSAVVFEVPHGLSAVRSARDAEARVDALARRVAEKRPMRLDGHAVALERPSLALQAPAVLTASARLRRRLPPSGPPQMS